MPLSKRYPFFNTFFYIEIQSYGYVKIDISFVGLVRLVNGPSLWHGRLEIFHDGKWGTVCDDYFGKVEAMVVCRQLGYTGGHAFVDNQYGVGNDPIWLDDVDCDGTELALSECEHND